MINFIRQEMLIFIGSRSSISGHATIQLGLSYRLYENLLHNDVDLSIHKKSYDRTTRLAARKFMRNVHLRALASTG